MSNHVANYVSGPGILDHREEAIRVLGDQKSCGRYMGYDFVFHEDIGELEFSSRNNSPVAVLAELSKQGPVELVRSSEADAYQVEKAFRFEDGHITGQRERFVIHEPPEQWPEWQPVDRETSDQMLAKARTYAAGVSTDKAAQADSLLKETMGPGAGLEKQDDNDFGDE